LSIAHPIACAHSSFSDLPLDLEEAKLRVGYLIDLLRRFEGDVAWGHVHFGAVKQLLDGEELQARVILIPAR
jgi:hypothetical protein